MSLLRRIARRLGRLVGRNRATVTDGSGLAPSDPTGPVPDAVLQYAALAAAVFVGVALLSRSLVLGIGVLALVAAAVTVASAVEIVEAYEKEALTVFGEYRTLLEPGVHLIPPFVSRTYPFDMRTRTLDVPRQEAITRDNSPVTADAVVYARVMDAKRAFLEVDDYENAVSNLAQTTLRAVLGDMELDDTLARREEINARIHDELDEATDQWGIRVEAVEVREVSPSEDVKSAMEQQSSAERHRRAMILEAQGERRSAVESAEGEKSAAIITAQGEKQSQILEAQGDAIATVLRAKSAESMGERAIIERGMDTLSAIGQGESTTFVLPQELSSLVGRYGKHLSGSDVAGDGEGLDSLDFDEETRELLGLEDIGASLEELVNQADSDLSTGEAVDIETEDLAVEGDGVDGEGDGDTEDEPDVEFADR